MNSGLACPACGAVERFVEIESMNEYVILRCSNCDLEFSNPMRNPGGSWYDQAYRIRNLAVDNRIRDYFKWAVSALPQGGRLLDVGCGHGVFVNYARKKGFDAYGVDFSKEAIELGKRSYGLNTLFACDMDNVKEAAGVSEFDVVTFFEVLEHLDDPREFVANIKKLLKKGGHVALSVPYRDRFPCREFGDYPPHHLTWWSEKPLREFFQECGFEIISMHFSSGLRSYHIFLWSFIRRIIYGIFGISHKGYDAKNIPGRDSFILDSPGIKRFASIVKPRTLKDIVLWPFVLITYPVLFPYFKGYNLMLLARLNK